MSDGLRNYWKVRKIENMVKEAANATARVIQRPDLDKTPVVIIHGSRYRFSTTPFDANAGRFNIEPIPVLGQFKVEDKE